MARYTLPLLLLLPTTALAQVGHAPESSPYRDIPRGSYFVFTAGSLGGSGGKIGVAPHNGTTYGVQFNLLANKPLQVGFGLLYADAERLVRNPTRAPATRTTGPFTQDVVFADIALQFNLTGGKSWHRVAPFIGGAVGLAFAGSIPEDSTGFKMGTKGYIAPMIGTRVVLSERLHLQVDARALFWQAKYPPAYREAPSGAPTTEPVLPDGVLAEWIVTPWLRAGLGWSISLPF